MHIMCQNYAKVVRKEWEEYTHGGDGYKKIHKHRKML